MKTYQIPVSNTWWLKKKSYFFFVIREMTSLFVAGYCLFLLVFTSFDLPSLYSVPCNYMV